MGKRRQREISSGSSEEETYSRRYLMQKIRRLEKSLEVRSRSRDIRDSLSAQRSYSSERSVSHRHSERSSRSRNSGRSRSCKRGETSRKSGEFSQSEGQSHSSRLKEVQAQSPVHAPDPVCSRVSVNNGVELNSTPPLIVGDEPASNEMAQQGEADVISLHADGNLSDDTLNVLGEDPAAKVNDEVRVHGALASRWSHILANGLPTDTLKELVAPYDVPTNLTLLKPPGLNPEVASVLSKPLLTQDATLVANQQLLNKAISALSVSFSSLLEEKGLNKDTKSALLSNFSNSGRILCHIFHRLTLNRRNLISPLLDKGVLEAVKDSPPCELLFGADFGERIRTAKNILAVSKDIKKAGPRNTASNSGPSGAKKGASNRSLNSYRPVVKRGTRTLSRAEHRTENDHRRSPTRSRPGSKATGEKTRWSFAIFSTLLGENYFK